MSRNDYYDDGNPYAPPRPDGAAASWKTWQQSAAELEGERNFSGEPFHVEEFREAPRYSISLPLEMLRFVYRWFLRVFLPIGLGVGSGIFLERTFRESLPPGTSGLFFLPPILLLLWWLWRQPYWYLNGIDRNRDLARAVCPYNGHHFPEDFFEPFENGDMYSATFGFNEDGGLAGRPDGFFCGDLNIVKKIPGTFFGTPVENMKTGIETVYWRPEARGLRFFGARMNLYLPFDAIREVVKGTILFITLRLDRRYTREYEEIVICLAHKRTLLDEWRFRDALYERLAANVRNREE